MGRIKSLEVSFIIQGVSLFLLAALIRESELTTGAKSKSIGMAAAAFVFVFLWFFTMFNIGEHHCHVFLSSSDASDSTLLDLFDRNLASGDPCERLQLHHPRLGHWLW